MKNEKTKKLVTLAVFGAIVVVLQLVATFIKIGSFPITLTLVPVVIIAAKYGPFEGGLMGLIFGAIVLAMVVVGVDVGGASMFAIHPVHTATVCLLKGFLAGFVPGLVYKKINNKKAAIVVAGALAPICNTGTLIIFLILFFDTAFAAAFGLFISINFLIELVINMLLAPGLLRIIK